MSLRIRLVRAFFLLAVVPLTGVSVYSYVSTKRAYRRAMEAEAAATADDLNGRLSAATRDMGRRLERLGELPFGAVSAAGHAADPKATEALLAGLHKEMGDAAPMLGSLEFIPEVVPSPHIPAQPAGPGAPGAPSVPPPAAPPAHGPPRALVIAPAAPTPGADAADAAPAWVVKYKAIAEVAAAVGQEMAREAQRVETEVERQRDEAQRQAQGAAAAARPERRAPSDRQPEPEGRQGQREAEQLSREAQVEKLRQEFAEKAVRAAQLAMSSDDKDKQEAGRLAAETAAMAVRHIGAAIAREVRLRYAPQTGYSVDYPLRRDGAQVGTVRAQVNPQQMLGSVFARTRRNRGEIPFAVDDAGKLFVADADRGRIESLDVVATARARGQSGVVEPREDWVVVTRRDADAGLTLGIARPLGEGLKEIRNAAVKNLGYGLGMTGLALVGILPLSRRLTRDLGALTEGATRLAHGDLESRVPVRTQDEVGRLAEAFNRMAADLKTHQEQLLHQERLRKELEMGRRIQEEMLPHEGLRVQFAEAKGLSIPAREVGGDFFNYFPLEDGLTALMIGDVSGKGVGAALLMANLQATLRARMPLEKDLTALARHLDYEIDRTTSTTVYLTAFIGVLDGTRRVMRYVNAGHNAPFLLRRDGSVLSLDSTGRPLGLYPGGDFEEKQVVLGEGDSLLLYTDGVVESEDAAGEPFGTERLKQLLIADQALGLDGILSAVEQAVRQHRGGREADDDATLVVLKVGPPATPAA